MTNEEFEFTLQDVKSIIQSKNQIYDLEHRSSISFSGGSDSMLMHCLIDESIPNNNIPRIYMNTGIEHQAMRKYVQELAKKDKRFIILTPKVNIPKMLKKDGYPFKSKQHSQNYGVYFRNKEKVKKIMNSELEEFEEMYNWIYCNTGTTYEDDVKLDKIRKNVKLALQRLESIDNANPSEALECLHKIAGKVELADNDDYWEVRNAYAKVENTLLKAQEQEKVLSIIKEKPQAELSLIQLGKIKTYEEYLNYTGEWELDLYGDMVYTEEEFDLLKRWLG